MKRIALILSFCLYALSGIAQTQTTNPWILNPQSVYTKGVYTTPWACIDDTITIELNSHWQAGADESYNNGGMKEFVWDYVHLHAGLQIGDDSYQYVQGSTDAKTKMNFLYIGPDGGGAPFGIFQIRLTVKDYFGIPQVQLPTVKAINYLIRNDDWSRKQQQNNSTDESFYQTIHSFSAAMVSPTSQSYYLGEDIQLRFESRLDNTASSGNNPTVVITNNGANLTGVMEASGVYTKDLSDLTLGDYEIVGQSTSVGGAVRRDVASISVVEPVVTLSHKNATVGERGNNEDTIVATIPAATISPITVVLNIEGGVLDTDYSLSSANIVIPAGSTSAEVVLTVIDDGAKQPRNSLTIEAGSISGLDNVTFTCADELTLTIEDSDAGCTMPETPTIPAIPVSHNAASVVYTVSNFNENYTYTLWTAETGGVQIVEGFNPTTKTITGPFTEDTAFYLQAYDASAPINCQTSARGKIQLNVTAELDVEVTLPSNNSIFPTGQSIAIEANAANADTLIIYIDDEEQSRNEGSSASSISYTWNGATAGNYTIKAVAKNDNNDSKEHQVEVTVITCLPPETPVVMPVPVAYNASSASFEVENENAGYTYTLWDALTGGSQIISGFDATTKTITGLFIKDTTFYLQAYDASLQVCQTSARGAVQIVVAPAPTINLSSPADGASFNIGTDVNIAATAANADTLIVYVDDVEKKREIAQTSISYSWLAVGMANHSIKVVAKNSANYSVQKVVQIAVICGEGQESNGNAVSVSDGIDVAVLGDSLTITVDENKLSPCLELTPGETLYLYPFYKYKQNPEDYNDQTIEKCTKGGSCIVMNYSNGKYTYNLPTIQDFFGLTGADEWRGHRPVGMGFTFYTESVTKEIKPNGSTGDFWVSLRNDYKIDFWIEGQENRKLNDVYHYYVGESANFKVEKYLKYNTLYDKSDDKKYLVNIYNGANVIESVPSSATYNNGEYVVAHTFDDVLENITIQAEAISSASKRTSEQAHAISVHNPVVTLLHKNPKVSERDNNRDTIIATIPAAAIDNITVTLSIEGGVLGADYSLSAPSIVIPAGDTSAKVILSVIDDGIAKQRSSLSISVASVTGLAGVTFTSEGQLTLIIEDSDGEITTPMVNVISPNDGTNFVFGEDITIIAKGVNVDTLLIYANNQILHSAKSDSIGYVWTGAVEGTHTIKIVGKSMTGEEDVKQLSIAVVSQAAIFVNILTPSDGEEVDFNEEIKVVGVGHNTDSLFVFVNGDLKQMSLLDTITYSWVGNVSGVYDVKILGKKISGEEISKQISVTILPAPEPIVSILSPEDGAVVELGNPVRIIAAGRNADTLLTRINGVVEKTELNSDTIAHLWTAEAEGMYTIEVVGKSRFGGVVAKQVVVEVVRVPITEPSAKIGCGDTIFDFGKDVHVTVTLTNCEHAVLKLNNDEVYRCSGEDVFRYTFTSLPAGNHSISVEVLGTDGSTIVENLSIVVNASTDVNMEQLVGLKVYPNPVKDVLYLNTEDAYMACVELLNMMGERLLNQSLSDHVSSYSLSLEGFGKGLYVIRIKTTKGVISKIVVKN